MLLSLLFPCFCFPLINLIDFFSSLWGIQSSLTLSFYSNISTYCYTLPSKYCYFTPEVLVCTVCIVLAMDISFISLHLLQRDELCGHSWLTAPAAAPSDPVWHLARPHFPRLHIASDWAQQGCQRRAMVTGCGTLPMAALIWGLPLAWLRLSRNCSTV